MIDARNELSSVSSVTQPRRAGGVSSRSNPRKGAKYQRMLRIQRVFSDPKVSPFDQIEWDKRSAEITDDNKKVIFRQENIEVPKTWSMLATNVVVSKYFYGEQGTPEREHSVRQIVHRVCRTIADWGVRDGLFLQGRRRSVLLRTEPGSA